MSTFHFALNTLKKKLIKQKLAQISEHTPVSIVEVSLFVDTLTVALVAGEGEVAGRELHETV